MRVWIVVWMMSTDTWDIEGVFASKEDAERYAASKGERCEVNGEVSYLYDGNRWDVTSYDVIGAREIPSSFDACEHFGPERELFHRARREHPLRRLSRQHLWRKGRESKAHQASSHRGRDRDSTIAGD